MIKNKIKKLSAIFLASALTFSTLGVGHIAEAKGSVRSAPRPSAKPSSSKPSSSNKSSKPTTSTSSSKPTANSAKSTSSNARYNQNRNSYNNTEYKKQYTDYINTNYRSSGFFSGNSMVNMLLWYSLFNSATSHNTAQATDQQKELVDNVKDSNVPVYMLEIKTNDGETKYISVTKEQYDKVNEGDSISYKDGNLEIK